MLDDLGDASPVIRLVDNTGGGNPSCRCWISSFATEPTISAYRPSKYAAVNWGSISRPSAPRPRPLA